MSLKKATLLNAIAKYTTVVLQLIYTAILSRLLTPEDYGVVAIILVFIVFFQLFADMGLGTGVVQNKELTKKETNDIFSYTIYIGITLLALFSVFSILLSKIYNNKIYIPLGIELAVSLMFNAFNMIPNAILLKEKRFMSIAIRTVIISIGSFGLTILFAIKGFGVYALAANSVLTAIGLFIWNEFAVRLKFTFVPKKKSIKKIWGYSAFQFGALTLNYFNRNLDNLLIGKFFSASDLGQYNKAYTLMQYPITYLPGVITPVMHPILSEHQHDKQYIFDVYKKLLKILSLCGCFCSAFFWYAGYEIILIAFGDQWIDAILPFRILGLSVWAQILTNTMAPVYQSVGNTKLMFKGTIVTTMILICSILGGFLGGSIVSVAIAIAIGYLLNFFVSFGIVVKGCFMKSFFYFLKNFKADFLIFSGLMCTNFFVVSNNSIWISFVIKFVIFLFVYLVLLIITKQYKVLIKLLVQ